jgi:metal-sulfur cluster biosynthetic enzyme
MGALLMSCQLLPYQHNQCIPTPLVDIPNITMINQPTRPATITTSIELTSAMDLENAYIAKDPTILKCEYLSEGKRAFENVHIFVRGLEPQSAQDFGATLLSGLAGIAEPDYRGTMGEALVDIVNFGLVYGISADYPHRLEVFIRLTSPQCHQKHTIQREVLAVLAEADDRLAKALGGQGFEAFEVKFDHPLVPKWTQECISHNFRAVTDKDEDLQSPVRCLRGSAERPATRRTVRVRPRASTTTR